MLANPEVRPDGEANILAPAGSSVWPHPVGQWIALVPPMQATPKRKQDPDRVRSATHFRSSQLTHAAPARPTRAVSIPRRQAEIISPVGLASYGLVPRRRE